MPYCSGYHKSMSFIDNLRTMLASFSGNDTSVDAPVNFEDLKNKQEQYGTKMPYVEPKGMSENMTPKWRRPGEDMYSPSIPELWSVEDYDIIHKNEEGDGYYSKLGENIRIYRDNNGNFVGLDTPMQSYTFSPEEDGMAKIESILDGLKSDDNTIIQFRGRIENPRNPNNRTWRA